MLEDEVDPFLELVDVFEEFCGSVNVSFVGSVDPDSFRVSVDVLDLFIGGLFGLSGFSVPYIRHPPFSFRSLMSSLWKCLRSEVFIVIKVRTVAFPPVLLMRSVLSIITDQFSNFLLSFRLMGSGRSVCVSWFTVLLSPLSSALR